MHKKVRNAVHHLRRQPEADRRNLVNVFTLIAGIILVLLWTFTLGKTVSSPETKAKANDDLKPFSVLKDNLLSGYNVEGDKLPVLEE